jgi:ATP-binding cassette subfamily B protein
MKKETKIGQKKTLAVLYRYLIKQSRPGVRWRIVVSLLLLVGAKLINIYVPFIYKYIVDALSVDPIQTAASWVLWMVLAYSAARLSSSLFSELKDYVFQFVSRRAQRTLTVHVFEKLHQLSLAFHLERKTGKVTRYLEMGSRGIEFVLGFMLFNILPTLLEIIFVTVILLVKYNWQFALITFSTIALYIYATLALTEWRLRYRREMNESDSEANAKAVDSLINFETVKYFVNEDFEKTRYDTFLSKYEKSAIASQGSLSLLNVVQAFIIAAGLFWVMYLAGRGVITGTMTVGDFVLVNTFLIQLYLPLNFLGFVYREIKRSLIEMENMFSLLYEKVDIVDQKDAKPLQCQNACSVTFQNIDFSYQPDRQILFDVSFTIGPGQTTAIVGHSGSGKSTLSRLLYRFYEPQAGQVMVDGQNIATITQKSLRKTIGIVPQDTVLFNDTIAYNIQYGRTSATMEDIEQAAKQAQIHEFILSLPKGYDTLVGERGLKLSGGEKQRVAIARTILKNPSVLVLDEATSALDTHTEREIQQALQTIAASRTTLVIAHRLSTITQADEILVMEKGRIIERGQHDQLLKKNGMYASMWAQQQSAVEQAKAPVV